MTAHEKLPLHARRIAADANGFPRVREQLDQLIATYPALLLEDAVGIIVFGLAMRFVRLLPPKNVPISRAFRAKCEGAALEIVANAHLELLHRSGIVPVLAHPSRLERPLTEWWLEWRNRVLFPLATTSGVLDDRLGRIRDIASAIMEETLSEDLLKGVRVGTYMSRKEHGKPKHDSDDSPISFAATFWAIDPSDAKEDRCYVIGDDRKIQVNPRYVRDQHGRPHQRTMVGKVPPPPPADHFDERDLGSSGVHIPKERQLSTLNPEDDQEALEAVETLEELSVADEAVATAGAAEAVDTLQDVLDELIAENPAPLDRLLLERAPDLINEATNPTELARQLDLPESTVRHAWRRIAARLAAHPRLRGWGRIA